MKSFRQFITEESTTGPQPRSPEEILKNFRKRVIRTYRAKTGRDLSPKDLERIADAELEDIVRDSRGKSGERARKDVVKTQGQEDLLKKINRNRSRAFDPKGDKGKFFGKPTEVDIKYGKAKYIPPKDVDPSEFEGGRRRARRRYDPDFEKVQSNINRKEKLKQKFKQFEYDPDSKGGDPAPKKKTAKPEPGRSAKRRKPSKSVEQLKKEIEARTTKVKGSTIKGTKPPVLPKPTSVPGGTTPSKPTSVDFKPRGSSTPKFDSSYNPKAPDSSNPNRIDQREVSKRASKFTKDTNTARIEKLSKGRVKIDYGMPKPEKGIVARKVDPPKVKTQLSPDTLRSTNPKSNINTPYDKSKASKTFKDMASDSRKKLSRKGIVGRSKEYVKNLTNKIRNTFTKSKTKVTTTPKSTPKTRGTSKITSSGGKEIRSKLNQISKKPKTKFKLGGTSKITGALSGYSAYQQERDAGSSQGRSVSSGILQGASSAYGYQVVSNVAKQALKYAPIPRWTKGVLELGAGIYGSTAAKDKTKQAYDYVFPSKNKKTNTTNKNNNKRLLVPPITKKKSKPVDLSNTTLSLTGYDPSLDKNKKNKNKK